MATLHRNVSIGSLSSITSEGSVSKKNKKPTSVTIGFKCHWFETTLNFIKDDRRMCLNYGVTPAQAIFIRDVLSFEANPSVKLEKYAPLYEALKIFGLKYSFKLSRVKKDVLMLQKIPKPQKQFAEPSSTTKPLTPKMEREKKVIDRISREYMVEKAQTILDFIDDPTRVTLEFTKVKPLESMFLQTVMTAARPLFPEHVQMLEHVRKLKPTLDFSLQVLIGKINKKTNERTVTFKKDPKFSKKNKRSRENSLNRSNIYLNNNFLPSTKEQPKISAQNNRHNKENSTQKLNAMDVVDNKTNSMQNVQNSTPNVKNSLPVVPNSMPNVQNSLRNVQNSAQSIQNAIQAQNSFQNVQNSVQNVEPMDVDSPRSIGSMTSSSAISVRSDPVRVADRTRSASAMSHSSDKPVDRQNFGSQNNLNLQGSTKNTQHVSRRDFSALNPRKAKLLEAMSMPVQLDKPARMMQRMGWDGGPLGIRGVGITEPIIPALDLVSGAGFGHVKPAKQEAGQQSFRQELLETILDLLQTEKVTVSLVYPNMMSKKEVSFVRHAVTCFSERQKITLKNAEEARVAKLVIDALKRLPDVVIHGTSSACKKQITLRKVLIVRPQAALPPLPRPGVLTLQYLHAVAESVLGYRYAYNTPKQRRYLGTRITILVEILHFLQFSDHFKELIFEATLSRQEMDYIVSAVKNLNKHSKPPMCHTMTLEDDICNNILRVIGDCMLSVKFDQYKSGVLFEKAVPVAMKTYKNILRNEINFINANNNNTKQNNNAINGNTPNDSAMIDVSKYITSNNTQAKITNKSVKKVKTSKHILASIQNNFNTIINNASKDISNETDAKSNSTVENANKTASLFNKVSLNGTNNKKDSGIINKILEKRLENLDEPKTDCYNKLKKDTNIQSEDDDVILIETVRETIVISDDESDDTNTENTQNKDKSVIIDEVLAKEGPEIKISNTEENVDVTKAQTDLQEPQKVTECNITQWSAEMNVSNSQGSGEINMTRGSADMTVSNIQDCTAALDISNVQGNAEIDKTKESVSVRMPNSINKTEYDVPNIQEDIQTNANIDTIKEIASKNQLIIQDSTTMDVSNVQENSNLDTAKQSVNTSIINLDNSKLDVPTPEVLDKEEIEKTDITKVKLKSENKNLSYSEEFDKDLHDLEQVLLLDDDDDVFDYTIVKKEKDDSIDRIERPSSKRSRSDSVESSHDNSKKTKIFTFKNSKNLLIVHIDYPAVEITKECTIKIQSILSDAIEKCRELPLLKCHGIQDGGLVYSCHNEQSLFFIENSLSVTSDYKIISDVVIKKKPCNITIRFNSVLDNVKILFSRLELYNAGLITDCWCVKETQKYEDHLVIYVEIDEYSYKYICDNSFSLYAGIDEARFSVVWD